METKRLKSWQEFRDYLDSEHPMGPVYWRGQRDPNWVLASGFERTILRFNGGHEKVASWLYPYDNRYKRDGGSIWEEGSFQRIRDSYLTHFQRVAATLRGNTPQKLDVDEWWALGRHYGLVTPLLDWTEKPYIAAFFALFDMFQAKLRDAEVNERGMVIGGREVAIYRLWHRPQLERRGLRVLRPQVDELARLNRQWGVFTWLDSEKYFELEGLLNDTGRGDLLTKILLSDEALGDGLRDLDKHGVNYASLFPDLEGAAKYVNSLREMPVSWLV